MIYGKEIYDISIAIVPLYVATFLGYGSIRWWKIFTLDQCSGINRFVGVFAVPLLSFHYISSNDPYAINFRFIAADTLQKVVILVGLFLWHFFSKNGNIEWIITLFSLSFPNTLVMGIPLLNSMYGDLSQSLVVQIVILQSLVWYTIILFLYEYRGAKLLISEQFPENAHTITSFRIDSDVFSLDRRDFLETDVEIGDDGKLHVTIRRSTSSSCNKSHVLITPRPSNFSSVEIYSVRSSQVGTPRVSNVSHNDFSIMLLSKLASSTHMHTNSFGGNEVFSIQSSKEQSTPRTSNFDQDEMGNRKRLGRSMSEDFLKNGSLVSLYPPPRPMSKSVQPKRKEIGDHTSGDAPKHVLQQEIVVAPRENASSVGEMSSDHKEIDMSKFVANEGGDDENKHQMPPERVTARLTLIMVWRKLIRNPNTYATILGVIWSLVSFRWNIKMPIIVGESISILSNTGLGMAMFSLGLFMGLQPKIIACGRRLAIISIIVRFVIGPAVMAGTSAIIGIHAVYLQISIIQAALPQGIVPFVFAKEYNVHADVLSTAVSFGMLMAVPLTIMYYVLLGL